MTDTNIKLIKLLNLPTDASIEDVLNASLRRIEQLQDSKSQPLLKPSICEHKESKIRNKTVYCANCDTALGWVCLSLENPFLICSYGEHEMGDDICIFCEEPEERK